MTYRWAGVAGRASLYALDESDFLALVEHALITAYLTVGYALSADLPDAGRS